MSTTLPEGMKMKNPLWKYLEIKHFLKKWLNDPKSSRTYFLMLEINSLLFSSALLSAL
jgi:hypothetical protein